MKFCRKNSDKIGILLALVLFIVLSTILCFRLENISSEVFQKYNAMSGIESKLDLISTFLLNQNIDNSNFKSILLFFFILAFSTIMGIIISIQLDTEYPSHLIFTKKSEEFKTIISKKRRHENIKIMLTFGLGVFSSLVATYIFEYFLRK